MDSGLLLRKSLQKNLNKQLLIAIKKGKNKPSGYARAIQSLIALGANVDFRIKGTRRTPLMVAAYYGNISALQVLLQHPRTGVTAKSADEKTALIFAAQQGHAVAVNILHAHYPQGINERDGQGLTALMHAIQWGHLETVKALLCFMPDASIIAKNGRNALRLTAKHGSIEMFTRLMSYCPAAFDNRILVDAAQNGHEHMIRFLLTQPFFKVVNAVNAYNEQGMTALMMAALINSVEIAKLLMQSGAKINKVNSNGVNALNLAFQHRNFTVMEYLLQEYADVDIVNNHGLTVLMLAAQNGDLVMVDFILKHARNISINLATPTGHTALFLATQNNHGEVQKAILAYCQEKSLVANFYIPSYLPYKAHIQTQPKTSQAELEKKTCDAMQTLTIAEPAHNCLLYNRHKGGHRKRFFSTEQYISILKAEVKRVK